MELRWKVYSNYGLPERSIPFSFHKHIISINSSFKFSAQCKKKTLKLFLIFNVYFNDRTCILDQQTMSPLTGLKATTLKQSNTSKGKVHKKEIVHGPSCDQAVLLPFCQGVLFFPSPPKKNSQLQVIHSWKAHVFCFIFSALSCANNPHSLPPSSYVELNEI